MVKRNGKQRDASAFRQGQALAPTFKQTITFTGTGANALPVASNDMLSDLVGRYVTVTKVLVEILPNLKQDDRGVLAQARIGAQLSESSLVAVPSGPFKILSNANPTVFVLDIRQMARIAPALLKVITPNSTELLNLNFSTGGTRQYTARVTTWCHVWPETNPNVTLLTAFDEEDLPEA